MVTHRTALVPVDQPPIGAGSAAPVAASAQVATLTTGDETGATVASWNGCLTLSSVLPQHNQYVDLPMFQQYTVCRMWRPGQAARSAADGWLLP